MGNIEKRGENSYRFTVYVGLDAKGKYKRKTKTYKIEKKFTPKQLEEHLDHEYLKFKQEVLSGEYIAPEKMTFAAFTKEWEKKFAETELSETTFLGHISRLQNHIIPVIGHLPMDGIRSMMLLDLLSNLTRKDGKGGPLSNYAKEDIYKTLNSVFKYAVQWRVISMNPMDGVNKPKDKHEEERDVDVYEPEEVEALFKAAENEPFHWRMFITLAITAGVRRGENLGLEWSKVNFENSMIDITQTIVVGKKGALIKGPKSKASKRLVTLPPSVVAELKRYRTHWVTDKLRMGDGWTEHDREWLYCNEDGSHFYPSTPSSWWRKFTKKAGIRHIRLHDLRHTSATLLIAQGVHAKTIAERLGHSRIQVTMDTYGHVLRSADQAAADTFEILFKSKSK